LQCDLIALWQAGRRTHGERAQLLSRSGGAPHQEIARRYSARGRWAAGSRVDHRGVFELLLHGDRSGRSGLDERLSLIDLPVILGDSVIGATGASRGTRDPDDPGHPFLIPAVCSPPRAGPGPAPPAT